MDISSYVLLSQEQALKRRLDVVSNNMANSSTAGFRSEQPVFHEQVENTREASVDDARPISFVLDYRPVHDTAHGAYEPTGNPLDAMIDGPGYFAVEAPGGGTAYTRAGYVKVSDSGDLVTAGGQRLLDESGSPINVPTDQAGQIAMGADGTISVPTGPLGRLAVTVFDDETGVTPRGDGLMSGQNGRVLQASETKLRTGGVEGSNVSAIGETTAMIDILRSYQNSIRMSESMNDLRKTAIGRLSRLS
ncbi:flagellar basal-body rod protein FlgF [soil metagenome]